MNVAKTILQQLGGNKFLVMTGAKDLIGDESTLRMTLPRNASKANRLTITLDKASDTYTMRFFRFIPGKLDKNTFAWIDDKLTEVEEIDGCYWDMLQDVFTRVTGFYTSLSR